MDEERKLEKKRVKWLEFEVVLLRFILVIVFIFDFLGNFK